MTYLTKIMQIPIGIQKITPKKKKFPLGWKISHKILC